MRQDRPTTTALVLSGGGARGAYQAGVLRALTDCGVLRPDRPGFEYVVGSSAGALNAGMIAAHADRIGRGVRALEEVWKNIEPDHVFRTDLGSLGGIGFRWVRDLSFGGLLRASAPKFLLDTAPLRALVSKRIPCASIGRHVESGALGALAIVATNLYTADGVVFLQAHPEIPLWERGRWLVERTRIGPAHLLASSAIPIFFPSVRIDGRYFGDGSIRNTAPLSPAIQLGADRILAVGVRSPGLAAEKAGARHEGPPSLAQVASTLLDAVMLDALEVDVEHGRRVNIALGADDGGRDGQIFRRIGILHLSPRYSFGEIAAEFADQIPRAVRYLLRGLGDDRSTMELVSYLLFDASYCRRLMEIGAHDVLEHETEIRSFFADAPEG